MPVTAADPTLRLARHLAATGEHEAAKLRYLDVLCADPGQTDAMVELGALALSSGQRAAAATAFEQAVRIQPDHVVARTGLGSILYDLGDLPGASLQYRAALQADPDFAVAHQGLARVLTALGDPEAARHWQSGFGDRPILRMPYHGPGCGIPLLLMVSGMGGNLHTNGWIDDRRFAVTAVYADAYDRAIPLPPHSIALNAIGDADLCAHALARAGTIAAAQGVTLLNPPTQILRTSRAANAARLTTEPDIIAPAVVAVPRRNPETAKQLGFPLLLRTPGFHTGQFFVRVDSAEALAEAAASLPGEELLAMQYIDTRSAEGLFRKYRVMFIDGQLYPLHLAISEQWKVHYFSAAMADQPNFREEENRFLTDMAGALGARAMSALRRIQAVLGLDYAGVDFALAPDGRLVLFEANATMVIAPIGAAAIWDYRRPAIDRALQACRQMLTRRVAPCPPEH